MPSTRLLDCILKVVVVLTEKYSLNRSVTSVAGTRHLYRTDPNIFFVQICTWWDRIYRQGGHHRWFLFPVWSMRLVSSKEQRTAGADDASISLSAAARAKNIRIPPKTGRQSYHMMPAGWRGRVKQQASVQTTARLYVDYYSIFSLLENGKIYIEKCNSKHGGCQCRTPRRNFCHPTYHAVRPHTSPAPIHNTGLGGGGGEGYSSTEDHHVFRKS